MKEEEKKETKKRVQQRCYKCNAIVSKGNTFCVNCGANQNEKPVIKEEKVEPKMVNNKTKNSNNNVLYFIITLIICVALTIGICMYFSDNNSYHINNSNRNVTVDDTGIADAVAKVYDAVVVVENYAGDKLYGSGSGFVYKTDSKYGYILTNSHVINNATSIKAIFTTKESVKVDVVGVDEFSDIAVLKVPKKYVIQIAIAGDNSKMRVGDTTFAVGAPLDSSTYSWSVTRGILSGKDRMVSSETNYMNVLQTDTPINSGNSGGPLCNANGEVIGITNMKLASDQIEGMGFAIPIETATKYADQFISGKQVKRPYIGVSIYDSSSFFEGKINVIIDTVEQGSAAAKAGLKSGDIILKVNNTEITSSSHFKYQLYSHNIGDKVKITVSRDGKEQTFTVTLGTNNKEL